jgi:CheY-like chemotaxis protein
MLEELGFDALAQASGRQALTVISTTPTLDLLVCEIQLVGISGPALVDVARERFPILPAVLTSGSVDNPRIPAGCTLLFKPITLDQLSAAVRTVAGPRLVIRDVDRCIMKPK